MRNRKAHQEPKHHAVIQGLTRRENKVTDQAGQVTTFKSFRQAKRYMRTGK